MFQFPPFGSAWPMDSARPWRDMTPAGFSHSEISGSKPVCDSPELIAANYVLHRHLTPRHPSCALSSLTTNLGWMVSATINWRDTPSQVSAPGRDQDPRTWPIPWDLADAVQGRDRSSSSELRSLDSIDARFHSLKTRFRVVVIYGFVKERSGILSTPDPCPSRQKGMRQSSIRWSVRDSNPRPPACKADALPAELTPQSGLPASPPDLRWAWKDLNFRPHAYQACALTN